MNSLPSSLLFSQSGERNCVARSLFFWHQQTRREKKQGKKFSIHCLQAGKEKGKEEGCFRKALRRREKKFLFGQKKLVASPLHFLSSAWTGRKKISNFSTSSTLPPIKESSTFSLSLSPINPTPQVFFLVGVDGPLLARDAVSCSSSWAVVVIALKGTTRCSCTFHH